MPEQLAQSEQRAVAKWVVGTLRNDAQISALVGPRVYRGQAPEGAQYPHILVEQYAPTEYTVYVAGHRADAEVTWIVRVVDERAAAGGSAADVAAGAARVAELLDVGGTRNVDGWTIDGPRAFSAIDDTPRYLGGRMRVEDGHRYTATVWRAS